MCKMDNHNLHSFRANVLWIWSHTTLFSNKYYELNVDDSFLNTQIIFEYLKYTRFNDKTHTFYSKQLA